MPDNSILPSRKSDHIKINIENDVQSGSLSGFELYRFRHNALPEINLAEIDTKVSIFDKALSFPLLISSMTGGTAEAAVINQRLAEAAQTHRLAMGLGSQRAAIEKPELVSTFKVRKHAPDILLFANLGAVQLNYGYSVDQCMKAVEMIEADALFLHLNSLQEALQPEGDTNFGGLLQKIEIVCKKLPVPVVIKEVGWGITGEVARRLSNVGVQGIDVAGAGGTSWSQVESFRITDEIHRKIAKDFHDWGVSTAECIEQVKREAPGMLIFASGGIKNGIDIAKSIALGASLCGLAGPFVRAAVQSLVEIDNIIEYLVKGLRIAMFGAGFKNLGELQKGNLSRGGTDF